ncbi:DegV family protein [Youngiibacter multivorans]|uniref:DegV family protein with EDD domain n=1 Tax=Youngiibacter multivorans TaxID=937251 RepID=A0ABS4G5C0_9CLOT|nr:DegV family protein [Youngiibacter multivorans]MBP1919755.1 DegV family protein with EDD domain [Youngiibacter multivorans]
MEKIKIVTDSTADLTRELIEEYDIEVVPLTVHIGEESFKDGSLTLDEFFERMKKSSSFPTTSQVNPQDFHDVYKKYLNEGYKILSIHISSALSGTGQSAQIAKDMLESEDIVIIDTMNVSAGIMISLIEAGKMVKAGKSLQEIEAEVRSHKDRIKLLAAFDTLENLVRGGRLSKAAGAVGGILGIKPILNIKDGRLEMKDKVRGTKKALKALTDFAAEAKVKPGTEVVLIHAKADDMVNPIKAIFDSKGVSCRIVPVGTVIATHGGPGFAGVFYLEA